MRTTLLIIDHTLAELPAAVGTLAAISTSGGALPQDAGLTAPMRLPANRGNRSRAVPVLTQPGVLSTGQAVPQDTAITTRTPAQQRGYAKAKRTRAKKAREAANTGA